MAAPSAVRAAAATRWGGRSRLHRSQLFLVGVAVACGIGGAAAAVVFRIFIRFFTALFFGGGDGLAHFFGESWLSEAGDPLARALALPWWARLAIPALGGLIVGPLAVLFPREAKGHGVPEVMEELGLLGLEIQRMPKGSHENFSRPSQAHYLSVVSPGTHDMSTIRGWWLEDRANTQKFFNDELKQPGPAPLECDPWISREIIRQHLESPAMWSIFQLQDILGMSDTLRREKPQEERINDPANSKQYWQYRMHISLEDLIKEKDFTEELKGYVVNSGRNV